ncbi:MAG: hypothetical protein MZU97_10550 [Bacillus subtilis]|nr:hypothetical protein [Bacillus subtilis]
MLARALSLDPKLIVADEPVSMIDVSLRLSILKLMSDLNRRLNVSFLFYHARSCDRALHRRQEPHRRHVSR